MYLVPFPFSPVPNGWVSLLSLLLLLLLLLLFLLLLLISEVLSHRGQPIEATPEALRSLT